MPDIGESVCAKLGISTPELNALYVGCPVDGFDGRAVEAGIRARFDLGPGYTQIGENEFEPDGDDWADQLVAAGILTPEEGAWLYEE